MSTVYVIGSGPSISDFDLAGVDDHVCAVSSGINCMGDRVPEHFVAMDHPKYFNADLFASSNICKHTIQEEWRHHLNLRQYDLKVNCAFPNFSNRGSVSDGDLAIHFRARTLTPAFLTMMGINPIGAISQHGQGIFNNSLLMAVQVMPRMGYDRIVFAGCDLNDYQLHSVADVLRSWQPAALRWGVEWFNASPASRLASFIPAHTELVNQ